MTTGLNLREFVKFLLTKMDSIEIVRKYLRKHRCHMKFPPYDPVMHQKIVESLDPVRYGALALALTTIQRENIAGCLAEAGVYRGETSKVIRELAPGRFLYLFDTFEGFQRGDRQDTRFKETDEATVGRVLGNLSNVKIRKGYFPDTARGLEGEKFSFVMLDMDKYEPTLEGLKFFYPRLSPGGYIFLHDFNSPESERAVSRAVQEFLSDKPERIFELPDYGGSAILRKNIS